MAKNKVSGRKIAVDAKQADAFAAARRRLKEAMSDFDGIEVAEPAVKPQPEVRRAIRKAVRAYYRRDALERT